MNRSMAFGCLAFCLLSLGLPNVMVCAAEPWDDPPRYSNLTDEQKAWIKERTKIWQRINQLVDDDADDDDAKDLVKKVADKDIKLFERNPDELGKTAFLVARIHYRCFRYDAALKAKQTELAIYQQAFGENNWRARSTRLKLMMWQGVVGDRGRRDEYEKVWTNWIAGDALRDEGRYSEARDKYLAAAKCVSRVGKSIRNNDFPEGIPDEANVELGKVLREIGRCHHRLAEYADAERYLRDALQIIKGMYGTDHPVYGSILVSLAGTYQDRGQLPQAELALRQAIESFEKAYGHANREEVEALAKLGRVYWDQRRYSLAESLLQKAMAQHKVADDPWPSVFNDCLWSLAGVYQGTGRLEEAEKSAREAVEFCKSNFKESSQDYINAIHQLSKILKVRGKIAEALEISEKALELQIGLTGGRHPYAGIVGENTAMMRLKAGKSAEAEELLLACLGNLRRNYGDQNSTTRNTHSDLCALYGELRDERQKQRKSEAARDIQQKLFNAQAGFYSASTWSVVYHKQLLSSFESILKKPVTERNSLEEANRLAVDVEELLAQQKYKEALPLAEKILTLRRAAAKDHPFILAESLTRLATIQERLNLQADAATNWLEALDLYRKSFTGSILPPSGALALYRIGVHRRSIGQAAAALDFLEEARDGYRRLYGYRHTDYVNSLQECLRCRLDLREYEGLEAMAREVLDRRAKVEGPESAAYRNNLEDLATVLRSTNQLEAAEKILRDLLAQTKPAAGTPNQQHIRIRNQLGLLLRQAGKLEPAARFLEQCVEDYEKHSTSDGTFAVYLRDFGTIQCELGEFGDAEGRLRKAIVLMKNNGLSGEGAAVRLADALARRSQVRFDVEQFGEAQKASAECTAVLREQFGEKHWRVVLAQARQKDLDAILELPVAKRKALLDARAALRSAKKARENSQFAAALKQSTEALSKLKEVLGAEHLQVADAFVDIASLQADTGKIADAFDSLKQAVTMRSKILGAEHPETAKAQQTTASLTIEVGDAKAAVPLFHSLAATYSKQCGPESSEHGRALVGEGLATLRSGDIATARPLIQSAVQILRRFQVENPAEFARALHAESEWQLASGGVVEAEAVVRSALAFLEATARTEQGLASRSQLLLARVLLAQGSAKAAGDLAAKTVEALRLEQGEASLAFAEALAVWADAEANLGNRVVAEDKFKQAIRIGESALGARSAVVAPQWEALAMISLRNGEVAEAEKRLAAAREARNQKQPSAMAASAFANATLRHQKGELAEAEKLYLQNLESLREQVEALTLWQSEPALVRLNQQTREALDRLISMPATQARNEAIYAQILQWKGAASARARLLLAARGNPELNGMFNRLENTTIRLATVATRVPYAEERTSWAVRVEALTREREALEEAIIRKSGLKPNKRADAKKIAEALPAKTVLVDFVEYYRGTPPHKERIGWAEEPHFAAFIITKNGPIRRVDLGPSQPIADAIHDWRNHGFAYTRLLSLTTVQPLNPKQRETAEQAKKDFDLAASDLSRSLWKPLAEYLDGFDRVILSPDGDLGRFPFGGLLEGEGGGYVLERMAIHIVPIPGLLPELLARTPIELKDSLSLALFGGVDYNSVPEKIVEKTETPAKKTDHLGSTLFGREVINVLLNTGPEVQAIGKSFAKVGRAQAAKVLLEKHANENQFRAVVGASTAIHLATHGFSRMDLVPHALGRFQYRPVHVAAPSQRTVPSALYYSGLFSGIILAGANEINDPDEDDGILWCLEIGSLDLRRIELAVLSACDAANGPIVRGEGVAGVQYSFHGAGVKSVISTLWPVYDYATRLLMERFYANLLERKMNRLEAMREAQIWLLQTGRKKLRNEDVSGLPEVFSFFAEPTVWAPFLLSGDWR